MHGGRRPRILLLLALATLPVGCAEPEPERGRVLLIGLDGMALPLLEELTAGQAVPSFSRLFHEGAHGPLASLRRALPFGPERGVGWWSPLVWTSVATGKTPEVHGVVDFRLPNPETVQLCTLAGALEARLRLPPVAAARALRVLPSAAEPAPGWAVAVAGGTPREIAGPVDAPVPDADPEAPTTVRFLRTASGVRPLCLNALHLLDAHGGIAHQIHFVSDRGAFLAGWDEPSHGRLYGASPRHRAVDALWNIAGRHGRKVAVVSWRDSWPVETVNGYAISDRLGRRFASRREPIALDERQYHPETVLSLVEPLLARTEEVDALADRTLLDTGACENPDAEVARVQHWKDWLTHQAALQIWDGDPEIDLMAVYYAGPDGFGHMFMAGREADAPCRVEPPLVDRYYALTDAYLADWWERLGDDVTLVIATDHGMSLMPKAGKGEHADNGFVALGGRGVEPGAELEDTDVLDVAPLVLYLLGLPLAADMPGEPPWNALDRDLLRRQPPARVPTHEVDAVRPDFLEPPEELEEELRERLRALGYID